MKQVKAVAMLPRVVDHEKVNAYHPIYVLGEDAEALRQHITDNGGSIYEEACKTIEYITLEEAKQYVDRHLNQQPFDAENIDDAPSHVN